MKGPHPGHMKNFILEVSVDERPFIEGGEHVEEADHKETTRPRSQLEIQPRDDTNVQEQTRQANRQNWNKTESLSKAVPKAGQQQQQCRIRYVQETLETSVPLEPSSHGRGRGAGADGARGGEWAAGPWLVSVT